jgi:hypothetical protein
MHRQRQVPAFRDRFEGLAAAVVGVHGLDVLLLERVWAEAPDPSQDLVAKHVAGCWKQFDPVF